MWSMLCQSNHILENNIYVQKEEKEEAKQEGA